MATIDTTTYNIRIHRGGLASPEELKGVSAALAGVLRLKALNQADEPLEKTMVEIKQETLEDDAHTTTVRVCEEIIAQVKAQHEKNTIDEDDGFAE